MADGPAVESWEHFDDSALDRIAPAASVAAAVPATALAPPKQPQPAGAQAVAPTVAAGARGAGVGPTKDDEGGEVEALLKSADVLQPKRMILKRDPAATNQKAAPDVGARPEKSLAQRERDYEAAKQRIFSDDALSPAPSVPVGSAKQSKKGGKRK